MTDRFAEPNADLLRALAGPLLSAADIAKVGVCVTFVDVTEPRVDYINDAGAEIFGYARAAMLNLSASMLMSPAERARREASVQRRPGEQHPRIFEVETLRKDGQHALIEVSVSLVQIEARPAVVSFFTDVSARRQAHEALARSEARFRHLIEGAPDAVWIVAQMRLCYVNPAAVKMLGYPDAASVMALSPLDTVHPDERALLIERSRKMLTEGLPIDARDYRTVKADGSIILVEVQSMPFEWEGGPALLAFGRDVTARRAMEAKLMQADRMSALGTLTAGIAHELNNPLGYATLGVDQAFEALERVSDRSAATEALRTCLVEVRDGVDRAASIVRQLRGFSRAGGETHVPVDVALVVDRAARLAHAELRHRAQLVIQDHQPPIVLGNPSRLEQVFLNLLINAAQSMPEGSPLNNRIRVSMGTTPDGAAFVEVADSGAGIPADVLPRIFDPFFTTKPVGVGTGLGLAICHEVVTSHGGTITVESALDRGSTFRVQLPAAPGRPAAPPPAAPTSVRVQTSEPRGEASTAERRLHAVVVDDEPLLADLLARMLGDRYEVASFGDGQDALAHLLSHSPIDLVLCDLMMPGMSGMDLYQAVAAQSPALTARFVFMTGGVFNNRVGDFLSTVINPCLEKPFSVNKLNTLLKGLFG